MAPNCIGLPLFVYHVVLANFHDSTSLFQPLAWCSVPCEGRRRARRRHVGAQGEAQPHFKRELATRRTILTVFHPSASLGHSRVRASRHSTDPCAGAPPAQGPDSHNRAPRSRSSRSRSAPQRARAFPLVQRAGPAGDPLSLSPVSVVAAWERTSSFWRRGRPHRTLRELLIPATSGRQDADRTWHRPNRASGVPRAARCDGRNGGAPGLRGRPGQRAGQQPRPPRRPSTAPRQVPRWSVKLMRGWVPN